MAAFERVDAKEKGAGTHEKYLALANRLADRFGVARAASEATPDARSMTLKLVSRSSFQKALPRLQWASIEKFVGHP